MERLSMLFSFLVVSVAGWLNHRQQHLIEYLLKENRVNPIAGTPRQSIKHAATNAGNAVPLNTV